MKTQKYSAAKMTVLPLISANIFAFLIHYLANVVFESVTLLYVSTFILRAFDALLAPFLASVILVQAYRRGYGKAFLSAIPLSLSYLIFSLPYFYVEFFSTYGMEDSIILAVVTALIMTVVLYAKAALLFFIIFAVFKLWGKNAKSSALLEEAESSEPFMFSTKLSIALFATNAAVFIYEFIAELLDTISFIADSHGTYRTQEIIYIIFSYIFLVVILLLSQCIVIKFCKAAKNAISKEAQSSAD